jgi:hypothetical protein
MSRKSNSVSQESAAYLIFPLCKLNEEAKVHVYVHIGQYALPSGVGGGIYSNNFFGTKSETGKEKRRNFARKW